MNEQKPILSEAFTVEDIHRLREYNHLRRQGMSAKEINEDTRRGAEVFFRLLKNNTNTPEDKKA